MSLDKLLELEFCHCSIDVIHIKKICLWWKILNIDNLMLFLVVTKKIYYTEINLGYFNGKLIVN